MPGLQIQTLDEQEAIGEHEEVFGAAGDDLMTEFDESAFSDAT